MTIFYINGRAYTYYRYLYYGYTEIIGPPTDRLFGGVLYTNTGNKRWRVIAKVKFDYDNPQKP
jgi:hypothetical protein